MELLRTAQRIQLARRQPRVHALIPMPSLIIRIIRSMPLLPPHRLRRRFELASLPSLPHVQRAERGRGDEERYADACSDPRCSPRRDTLLHRRQASRGSCCLCRCGCHCVRGARDCRGRRIESERVDQVCVRDEASGGYAEGGLGALVVDAGEVPLIVARPDAGVKVFAPRQRWS